MIPFVGPSYQLKTKRQGVQRSINLMPTRIESGSGKAAVYLKPVPGFRLFSPDGGGGGGGEPPAGPFTEPYYSDSCNYGFFQIGEEGLSGSAGGGFLLITDTYGSDVDEDYGFYLKLAIFNSTGAVINEVVSSVYASDVKMTTYEYGDYIYVGPVDHIPTGAKHLIKVNKATLAISLSVMLDTNGWLGFMPLNNPALVIINTHVNGAGSTKVHKVVNLTTGAVVNTLELPTADFGAAETVGNIAQSPTTGNLIMAADGLLYVIDYDDGSIIGDYTGADLGSGSWAPRKVQAVGNKVAVYTYYFNEMTFYGDGKIGIFNEGTTVLDGLTDTFGPAYNGAMPFVDRYVYRQSDNTFYFVHFTLTDAIIYGYSLTAMEVVYEDPLELVFPIPQPIEPASGSYVGHVDDNDTVYLSVFVGRRTDEIGIAEGYVVYAIPPA